MEDQQEQRRRQEKTSTLGTNDSGGLPVAIDDTVTSIFSLSGLPQTTFHAGAVAAAAEQRKRAQYEASCESAGLRLFVPLAADTFVCRAPSTVHFLPAVWDRAFDSSGQLRASCMAALFHDLAVCLQRGNAHILLRRYPLLLGGTR
jgi:hypothetical protein